ncbi:hypothetical protein Tco_1569306 [Tanacetum coccineum]
MFIIFEVLLTLILGHFKKDVRYQSCGSFKTYTRAFMMSLDVSVEYEHEVMNLTCLQPPAATVENTCKYRLVVEFGGISLTGFRSCASRSHYRRVSKQTKWYE